MIVKKKILSALLALCLLAGMLPLGAFAYTVDSGSCGPGVTWKVDSDGTLTIGGKGKMDDYNDANTPWRKGELVVRRLYIEPGVTRIGNNAFSYIGMPEVIIPSTVTEMGSGVFQHSGIKTAKIYANITDLPSATFNFCTSLERLYLSASIDTLRVASLANCWSLLHIYTYGSWSEIAVEKMADANAPAYGNRPKALSQAKKHTLTGVPDDDPAFDPTPPPAPTPGPTPVPNYIVRFQANGGSGTMADRKATGDKSYILPDCSFAPPAGKVFKAWDINGTEFSPGEGVKISGSDGAVLTVKALWKTDTTPTLTLHFSPGDGTGTMKSITVKSGESYQFPVCTFTPPAGKTFGGWREGGSSILYTDTSRKWKFNGKTSETHTYTAYWKNSAVSTPTPDPRWYIEYDSNGGTGSMVFNYGQGAGKNFTLPNCRFTPPAGKEFKAWSYGGREYAPGETFRIPEKDTGGGTYQIKALWKDQGGGTSTVPDFSDISSTSAWQKRTVRYVVEKGLMNGTGSGKFNPYGEFNRAQMVTILYRLEGEPKVSGKSNFTDLTQDWYKDAVNWASSKGLVNGVGKGKFAPGQPIKTRDFVVLLHRYASYKGYNTAISGDVDMDTSLPDYARMPDAWNRSHGITEIQDGMTAVERTQLARDILNGTDNLRIYIASYLKNFGEKIADL